MVVVSAIGGSVVAAQTGVADSCDLSVAAKAKDEADIKETMAADNAALNGGETAAVLPLYTDDGVFMPPFSESAVGAAAVKQAYDKVFDELKFHVKFTIAELVVMAPKWENLFASSQDHTEFRQIRFQGLDDQSCLVGNNLLTIVARVLGRVLVNP